MSTNHYGAEGVDAVQFISLWRAKQPHNNRESAQKTLKTRLLQRSYLSTNGSCMCHATVVPIFFVNTSCSFSKLVLRWSVALINIDSSLRRETAA